MRRGGGSEGGGVEGEGRSVWVSKKVVFDTSSGEHGMAASNRTKLYYNNCISYYFTVYDSWLTMHNSIACDFYSQ